MNIITTNCLQVEESRAVIPSLSALVSRVMQSAKVREMLPALATKTARQPESLAMFCGT